jgi:hypothetical protein
LLFGAEFFRQGEMEQAFLVEAALAIDMLHSLKQDTIVLAEHDMEAVFALADQITAHVYGGAIASGMPEESALTRRCGAISSGVPSTIAVKSKWKLTPYAATRETAFARLTYLRYRPHRRILSTVVWVCR